MAEGIREKRERVRLLQTKGDTCGENEAEMTQNDKIAACTSREDGTQMDRVKEGPETYGKKIGRL